MVDASRIQSLSDRPVNPDGDYVLYWMQQSQRVRFNHALEHSIELANRLGLPLLVGFGLMDGYPEANLRHYTFMLQGLREVQEGLTRRGIRFIIRRGQPAEVAAELARRAAAVICDRGYLRHQKRWRDEVADAAPCAVVQVESDVVVPVETTSEKAEFAARTIRPKIHRHLAQFLVPLRQRRLKRCSLSLNVANDVDLSDLAAAIDKLRVDQSVLPASRLIGGARAAQAMLSRFTRLHLDAYDRNRREPAAHATSMLAAYLHFGQISPIDIALEVRSAEAAKASRDAYLEELIVRRELAINYVHYTSRYDSYAALPAWSRTTLQQRATDRRPVMYTREQLEQAITHDPYWNAAQREMTCSGFMHNSMRMYWGKKIIEWSATPEEAFQTALYLNNRYFLCGRDPNSYANVAWLFGLHDRPWGPARPIFGTVRYMNAAGLDRKFDMQAYLKLVDTLTS